MTLNNVTTNENNSVVLEFSIDQAVFEAAVAKVYAKQVKNITIPGYRKGKAPRKIIEAMYGKGVFYEDALNDILPAEYDAALKESGAEAVSRPDFEVVSMEGDVQMKATIFVKPDTTIDGYKGLAVDRILPPVTDEDIDADIKATQRRNARTIEITDRAAQTDDIVTIDYVGTVDGAEFEGGKADGHNLKLGSGSFIPGFEDQIVGHNIGDEFDVNVTFPEDYHAEDLKGKAAVFHVKLNAIKFDELPELDDEFAKDVSDFDTFAAYREDVAKKIAERRENYANNDVEEALSKKLAELLEADIPEVMYENETENCVRDYDYRMRMQGLDLQTYFKYTGQTLDTLRANFRPQAENNVKVRLALEKIAELEGITVTDEEIEEELKKMAEGYQMELDQIKAQVPTDSVKADLLVRNAMKFVHDNAVVTDKEKADEPAAEEEEKAADEEPKA